MKAQALLELLDSPDPAIRGQGVELARSLGREAADLLAGETRLTADGLLWRPDGISAELLAILVGSGHPITGKIRRLCLAGSVPAALVADLARLPALTDLDLSYPRLSDLTALSGLTGIRRLSLRSHGLSDLRPLRRLSGLTELTLSQGSLESLAPLSALTGLRALTLREVSVASGRLPAGIEVLQLERFHSRIDNLDDLPLRALWADADTVGGFAGKARLQAVAVERCVTPEALVGLPVHRLALVLERAETCDFRTLRDLPMLQHLSFELPYQGRFFPRYLSSLVDLPALRVVDMSLSVGLRQEPYLEHWVTAEHGLQQVMTTEARTGSQTHPLRSVAVLRRTAQHWWQQGCRYRLVSPRPIERLISTIKAFRQRIGLRLLESRIAIEGLRGEGLPCLRHEEAIRYQGWLRDSGIPCRITGWTPERPPGSPAPPT